MRDDEKFISLRVHWNQNVSPQCLMQLTFQQLCFVEAVLKQPPQDGHLGPEGKRKRKWPQSACKSCQIEQTTSLVGTFSDTVMICVWRDIDTTFANGLTNDIPGESVVAETEPNVSMTPTCPGLKVDRWDRRNSLSQSGKAHYESGEKLTCWNSCDRQKDKQKCEETTDGSGNKIHGTIRCSVPFQHLFFLLVWRVTTFCLWRCFAEAAEYSTRSQQKKVASGYSY